MIFARPTVDSFVHLDCLPGLSLQQLQLLRVKEGFHIRVNPPSKSAALEIMEFVLWRMTSCYFSCGLLRLWADCCRESDDLQTLLFVFAHGVFVVVPELENLPFCLILVLLFPAVAFDLFQNRLL